MTRVLVTGAAGFIGSRLALSLRADGQDVRALVRPQHDTQALEAAGVEVVRGDASDFATVRSAADACRTIYHLAAARGAHKLGYRAYHQQNRRLSESVGRAALHARVERVVFTSSAMLTGYWGPLVQTEDTPARPNSPYRSSRLQDEEIFEQFVEQDGLDVVILRLPQRVMGPGARSWASTIRSLRERRICVLPDGGSVHSADVDDIVHALRCGAATPGIAGRRFLIGAPSPIPTAALLRTIADHLGVPFSPRIVPAAPLRSYVALNDRVYRWTRRELPCHFTAEFYSARVAFDLTRARRELGYSPRFELSESIGRTVSSLHEIGLV